MGVRAVRRRPGSSPRRIRRRWRSPRTPVAGDVLAEQLLHGRTPRAPRHRAPHTAAESDERHRRSRPRHGRIVVRVDQSFGNCPKYINERRWRGGAAPPAAARPGRRPRARCAGARDRRARGHAVHRLEPSPGEAAEPRRRRLASRRTAGVRARGAGRRARPSPTTSATSSSTRSGTSRRTGGRGFSSSTSRAATCSSSRATAWIDWDAPGDRRDRRRAAPAPRAAGGGSPARRRVPLHRRGHRLPPHSSTRSARSGGRHDPVLLRLGIPLRVARAARARGEGRARTSPCC